MRKLFTIALLAGAAVLSVPFAANAACAPAGSTSAGLRQAPVVFVGKVISVENQGRTATFDVLSVWKGSGVVAEVTVDGAVLESNAASGDDQVFQNGITYLVATTTSANPYRTDRCAATRAWTEIPSLIPPAYQDAVGAAVGHSPDPVPVVEESGTILDGPILVGIVGAIVMAIIFYGIARVTRGPKGSSAGTRRKPSREAGRARLPSIGRSSEGISGGLRRSGARQAERLRRGVRRRKKGRSSRSKSEARGSKAKTRKGGLRTDRLAPSPADDDSRETTRV